MTSKWLETLTNAEISKWIAQQVRITENSYEVKKEEKTMSNKAKQKYNLKCTKKYVTFYIKDKKLLEIANNINFQRFVKYHLQQILDRNKGNK